METKCVSYFVEYNMMLQKCIGCYRVTTENAENDKNVIHDLVTTQVQLVSFNIHIQHSSNIIIFVNNNLDTEVSWVPVNTDVIILRVRQCSTVRR